MTELFAFASGVISFVPPNSVFTVTGFPWVGKFESVGKGMDNGRFGFVVAFAGCMLILRCSGRTPGTNRTTTFEMACRFFQELVESKFAEKDAIIPQLLTMLAAPLPQADEGPSPVCPSRRRSALV